MYGVAGRRSKWQYTQAAPTPRILHLPRRSATTTTARRRKAVKGSPMKPTCQKDNRKGKLENLFDEERCFAKGAPVVTVPIVVFSPVDEGRRRRRERVEEEEGGGGMVEEEKWRFQAEMLRAECNLLRMEKEIAVKKMERRRKQMEKALRSCLHNLLSGRKKISEGMNVNMVLDEEINCLVEKLENLQRVPRTKDFEAKKCGNFDKRASFLQRQLEKYEGNSEDVFAKEIQEMAEASLSIKSNESFVSNNASNMEILRRKMERLSKGKLLERMENEYVSMMLVTTNDSVSSSSSSFKQIEFPDMSFRQQYKDTISYEERVCSGRCKSIMRNIVEQVRTETEQWSQMQEMLRQVRAEMEEMQTSRDFWEDRALDSDCHIQSLRAAVQEWRQKAISAESKTNELQTELSLVNANLETLRTDANSISTRKTSSPPPPRLSQSVTEKRVLICRLKGNNITNSNGSRTRSETSSGPTGVLTRSPLRDIGNILQLKKQKGKEVIPLHRSNKGRIF